MELRLEGNGISAVVSSKGAELQSVVFDGTERIWCGDPAVWGRRAPLLFPIIGRLRNGSYNLDGNPVSAPMHGFCRDREFDVISHSSDLIVLETRSDSQTKQVYPFDFMLEVSFSLIGNSIVKRHVVKNLSDRPMPFELGGHEAYSMRISPDDSAKDYCVRFEDIDEIEMFGMDEDGILTLPKTKVELHDGGLFQVPEELGIDTVILEGVPHSRVALENVRTGASDTIEFDDFPYLGIWTMAGHGDARYLCIEPWSALPDAHFIPLELGERPGVITLEPQEAKELSYTMKFE